MEDISYEEMGLAKNEGKVYDVLIRFGKLGAGEVSAKSGVPYGRVYDVLGGLVDKGLVEVVPEKSKKFIPSSPDSLIKLIEKKQKDLEKAKEKAREMKQFYEKKEKNPVIMGEGKRAFYKIVKEMKKTEKYGYTIKWSSEYRADWAANTRRNLKKGLDSRTLTRYDKDNEKDVREWLKVTKNMRKFENEGFACSIQDDGEVMLSLIKNNVTLLIRDVAFAKVMKKLFLAAYDKAEKIE